MIPLLAGVARALQWSALFAFRGYANARRHLLLALLVCLIPLSAAFGECAADRIDRRERVAHVFDGDTLRLVDGSRLRLIGIDTPELGRDGQPPEALAMEARNALEELLGRQPEVQLRFDAERHDRYGRLLAHAFLPDGTNVQAWLLAQGLASALVVPPNLWGVACYGAVEQRTRTKGRGVWAQPTYRAVAAADLPRDTRGFRIVQGRVVRIGESKKSVWLNLAGGVAVRIARSDLVYFPPDMLADVQGREIRARGRVYYNERRRELRLRVRHPAALELIGE